MATTGRPTKLTPEVQALIVEATAAGVPRHDAAAHAGIGASTLKTWLALGRKAKKGPYKTFFGAVKKAEAAAVVRNVKIIRDAAEKEWTAAAWWLERRRPGDFGKREPLVIREMMRQMKEMQFEFDRAMKAIAAREAPSGPAGGFPLLDIPEYVPADGTPRLIGPHDTGPAANGPPDSVPLFGGE